MSIEDFPWAKQKSPTTMALNSIVWTGTSFVVVGSSQAGGVILISKDSQQFEIAEETDDSAAMLSVTWTGKLLAAAGGIQGPGVASSRDGQDWEYVAVGRKQGYLNSIVWTGTQLLAGGDDGWLWTSMDAENWTMFGFVPAGVQSVAFSGRVFVAVRDELWTSLTGRKDTWTRQKIGPNYITGPTYVAWAGQRLIAVGRSGLIMSSRNGTVWDRHDCEFKVDLHCVTWTGDQFIVVGDEGLIFDSSPDCEKWTMLVSGTTSSLRSVAAGNNRVTSVGCDGTILVANIPTHLQS